MTGLLSEEADPQAPVSGAGGQAAAAPRPSALAAKAVRAPCPPAAVHQAERNAARFGSAAVTRSCRPLVRTDSPPRQRRSLTAGCPASEADLLVRSSRAAMTSRPRSAHWRSSRPCTRPEAFVLLASRRHPPRAVVPAAESRHIAPARDHFSPPPNPRVSPFWTAPCTDRWRHDQSSILRRRHIGGMADHSPIISTCVEGRCCSASLTATATSILAATK